MVDGYDARHMIVCGREKGRIVTRVLITVEPRMYREVLIVALRKQRPLIESVLAEPAALDHEAGRFEPHLIVCSHATQKVRDSAVSWIEVQVKDGLDAVICVDGERSEIRDLGIDDLLAILDEAEGTSTSEPTLSQA